MLVGFIAADGCIDSRDNNLCFNLSKKDTFTVKYINELLSNGTRKLSFIQSTNSVYLRFSSQIISQDLSKLGIVPRKTATLELPNLRPELMKYFLRGYIYGDGSVFDYGKFNFGYSIICTSIMGDQLKKYLKDHHIMDHCIVSKRKSNMNYSQVRWAGSRSLPLSQFVFDNDKMILLPRKHIKFHELKPNIKPLTGPKYSEMSRGHYS